MKETKENLGAGKAKVVEAKGDNEAPAMGGKALEVEDPVTDEAIDASILSAENSLEDLQQQSAIREKFSNWLSVIKHSNHSAMPNPEQSVVIDIPPTTPAPNLNKTNETDDKLNGNECGEGPA